MVLFVTISAPLLALTSTVLASPIQKKQEPLVTYLGNQGPILCMSHTTSYHSLANLTSAGGALTTSKGLVYTAGTVPSFNGSIVEGGIGPQTVRLPRTAAPSP